MADQTVELAFRESGVKALTSEVNALADAIDRLPAGYSLKGSGGGARMLPPGSAPSAPAGLRGAMASGGGGGPQQALAAVSTQVKVSVQAIAQAAGSGASGIGALIGALNALPPAVKIAVAVLVAAVAAISEAWRTIRGSITPSFQYGLGSVNGSRGVANALGSSDFNAKARALSDSIATNPYARMAAQRAGINPNNNPLMGDIDDPSKALKWLKKYGDPSQSSDNSARRADRASGGMFSDEVALLRAASPEMRQRALAEKAYQLKPEQLRAAADAQIAYNLAIANFNKIIMNAVGWLFGPGPKNVHTFGPGYKQAPEQKEALSRDKNTDALNRMTDALEGRSGMGSRGQSALPPGWGYSAYEANQIRRATRLGVI